MFTTQTKLYYQRFTNLEEFFYEMHFCFISTRTIDYYKFIVY